MATIIELIFGVFIIWAGYLVWFHQSFFFLTGFAHWEPVNRAKLGKRIGVSLIGLGTLLMLTAILTIWLGPPIAIITGVLAAIDCLLMVLFILMDQMGLQS